MTFFCKLRNQFIWGHFHDFFLRELLRLWTMFFVYIFFFFFLVFRIFLSKSLFPLHWLFSFFASSWKGVCFLVSLRSSSCFPLMWRKKKKTRTKQKSSLSPFLSLKLRIFPFFWQAFCNFGFCAQVNREFFVFFCEVLIPEISKLSATSHYLVTLG